MYCCYEPTTQSNELGPIWYLQPKLGFRRNSFMSLRPWHVPLAWHVSCGVNSPNSLATILGTVNLNANLSRNMFHLHKQTYHLSQIHIPIPKFLQSWKQENSPVSRPGHMPSPQRPQPRLLQLALLLQKNGQVAHRDERVGMLRSQLGLAAFQGSAVQPFSLAARGGALRW